MPTHIYLIRLIPFELLLLLAIVLAALLYVLFPRDRPDDHASLNVRRKPEPVIFILFGGMKKLILRIAWFESKLRVLAKRKTLSAVVVFALSFGGAAAVSIFLSHPEPFVHDEFSYLLAGDTFSQGRVANPTHPMWEHFETFHVLQRPTYASKFPPAQGLFLAAGQRFTGRPIAGVWLSFGLLCAALLWMFQGWFPPGWALLGAVLAALRLGFIARWSYWLPGQNIGYWSQSYWGGAVAATGGALVFGSLRRLWHRPLPRYGWLLGLGLAVLANSRPYEGLLIAIPASMAFGYWLFRRDGIARKEKARVLLPLLLVLGLTLSAMGYYNWRVTGDPSRFPHQEYERVYNSTPVFLGSEVREPLYRHEVMRSHYRGWAESYSREFNSLKGIVLSVGRHLRVMGSFHFGPLLLLPFLLLPWAMGDGWTRFASATGLFFILGLVLLHGWYPHYYAPLTPVLFVLMLEGMRRLRHVSYKGRRPGLWAVRSLVLSTVSLLAVSVACWLTDQFFTTPVNLFRSGIVSRLQAEPGSHLVFVRYQPDHNPHEEWVFNEADIDRSRVVWAREMGPEEDRALVDYFKDRRVWLLKADLMPPQLSAYWSLD